jgi:hypothetical protein
MKKLPGRPTVAPKLVLSHETLRLIAGGDDRRAVSGHCYVTVACATPNC